MFQNGLFSSNNNQNQTSLFANINSNQNQLFSNSNNNERNNIFSLNSNPLPLFGLHSNNNNTLFNTNFSPPTNNQNSLFSTNQNRFVLPTLDVIPTTIYNQYNMYSITDINSKDKQTFKYIAITANPEFSNFSFEEIRYKDMNLLKNGHKTPTNFNTNNNNVLFGFNNNYGNVSFGVSSLNNQQRTFSSIQNNSSNTGGIFGNIKNDNNTNNTCTFSNNNNLFINNNINKNHTLFGNNNNTNNNTLFENKTNTTSLFGNNNNTNTNSLFASNLFKNDNKTNLESNTFNLFNYPSNNDQINSYYMNPPVRTLFSEENPNLFNQDIYNYVYGRERKNKPLFSQSINDYSNKKDNQRDDEYESYKEFKDFLNYKRMQKKYKNSIDKEYHSSPKKDIQL